MEIVGVFLLFWAFVFTILSCRRKRDSVEYNPPNIHGASSWATRKLAKALFRKGGIPLGYLNGRMIYAPPGKHIITFGGTGSGKTTNMIVPAGLTWPHSLIAFDCTGEFAAIVAHERRKFGPVLIVNPCNWGREYLKGLKHVRYNPMGPHWLNPKGDDLAIRAGKNAIGWIAESWKDPYWCNSSRSLIQTVQMCVVRYEKNPNIRRVAEIVLGDLHDYAQHIVRKTDSAFIRDNIMRYAAKGAKDIKSLNEVIENTRTEMAFAMDDGVADCMAGTDFCFADCGRRPMTIIVILPPDLVEALAKLFRVMLFCGSNELMGGQRNRVPTLFVMDEYWLLQPDKTMVSNFAGGRKHNLTFWACMQDLHQLREIHGGLAASMLNNAGVKQWLEASDLEGSEYLSRMCGETEVHSYSKTVSFSSNDNPRGPWFNPNITESRGQQPRHLALPHEIREMAPHQQILFVDGVPGPILAERKPYFNTPLKRLARPNPYYRNSGFWKGIFS